MSERGTKTKSCEPMLEVLAHGVTQLGESTLPPLLLLAGGLEEKVQERLLKAFEIPEAV